MVNSHITIMIIIFQSGFLESSGSNCLNWKCCVPCGTARSTHFEFVGIECAKSIRLGSEIIV